MRRTLATGAALLGVVVAAGCSSAPAQTPGQAAPPLPTVTSGSAADGSSTTATPSATGSPSPSDSPDSGSGPAGGPVPAHFDPTGISFISPSLGWAIGTAPCSHPHCTSVVRTRDGGRTWVGIPAPRADVGDIRFVSPRDGWAFSATGTGTSGPVYSTHDGGASWHSLGLFAIALEAANGTVWAVVPRSDHQLAVERSPTSHDDFHAVATKSNADGRVVLHGSFAYVTTFPDTGGGSGTLDVYSDGGDHRTRTMPCSSSAALAASSDTDLAVVCGSEPGIGSQSKRAYTSANAGRSWTRVGDPPQTGLADVAAATTAGTFYTGDRSPIYVTRDAGRHWTVSVEGTGNARGFTYVGFVDTRDGVAAGHTPGDDLGAVWTTSDAGHTWAAHAFH